MSVSKARLFGGKIAATGARKLMRENLKLVWAKFSTLSLSVLMMCMYLSMQTHAHAAVTKQSAEPKAKKKISNRY